MKCRLECNGCGQKWIATALKIYQTAICTTIIKQCKKKFCDCCKRAECPSCHENKVSIWSEISE